MTIVPPLTWQVMDTLTDGRRRLIAYTYLYKFTIYEWPDYLECSISDIQGNTVDRSVSAGPIERVQAAANEWIKQAAEKART